MELVTGEAPLRSKSKRVERTNLYLFAFES
jgi:hypothetical protein